MKKKVSTKPTNVSFTSEEILNFCEHACSSKKALGIKIIDVRKKTDIADYFLICSGTSDVHVQSIADGVLEVLKKHKLSVVGVEGYKSAQWILVDTGNVVLHIFHEYIRDVYDLESLWSS